MRKRILYLVASLITALPYSRRLSRFLDRLVVWAGV
jgi:hypothetical protein